MDGSELFSNNITDENHMFGLSNEHLVDIPHFCGILFPRVKSGKTKREDDGSVQGE